MSNRYPGALEGEVFGIEELLAAVSGLGVEVDCLNGGGSVVHEDVMEKKKSRGKSDGGNESRIQELEEGQDGDAEMDG